MEILAARGLAPDDVLARLHVEDADRAFAVDGLADPGVGVARTSLVVAEVWSAGNWSVGEDLLQLIR